MFHFKIYIYIKNVLYISKIPLSNVVADLVEVALATSTGVDLPKSLKAILVNYFML